MLPFPSQVSIPIKKRGKKQLKDEDKENEMYYLMYLVSNVSLENGNIWYQSDLNIWCFFPTKFIDKKHVYV